MTLISRRQWQRLLLLALSLLLNACSTLAWYRQAAVGQLDLLSRREDLDQVIKHSSPPLSDQLRYLRAARDYASQHLALPDNGSYRSYAELQRDAAVWTLVVTPELSLQPMQWCYPLIGCQAYRGYFTEYKAVQQAHRWSLQGYDSLVLPTPAYSTLGWFDDPLLNTMLTDDWAQTAGLIFHELAHQVVYVDDDTVFNESFATWVEREGTRQWLLHRAQAEEMTQWRQNQQLQSSYFSLMNDTRAQLAALYRQPQPPAELRLGKQRLLQQLREQLAAVGLRSPEPLNNAQFAMLAVYEDGVRRFAELFQCHNGDWQQFYAAVEQRARWPSERRRQWLRENVDTAGEVCHLTRAPGQMTTSAGADYQ
ncbi:MAG: aminopeptidase [Wenzhouxiangellaceae bacterium]